jgi:hypothetical protein
MSTGTGMAARGLIVATWLTACGDAPLNSGPNVVVQVLNATGAPDGIVTLRSGNADTEVWSITWTWSDGLTDSGGLGTGVETGGEPVRFHVEVGEDTVDHTCHVHPDAVGNPDLVPTAVIYSEPLRVVCQSGWVEEEDPDVDLRKPS